MSEFKNTIDVLGDDAVMDALITRTITEFKDDQINVVGYRAFDGCSSLEIVDLPNATTVLTEAFSECRSLSYISIPLVTSIEYGAFASSGLKSICIPSVKEMTGQPFRDATSIEKIDAPILEKFSTLDVFYMTTKLTALILRNTEKVCALTGNYPEYGKNCYIYVPKVMADGSNGVEAYKSATNWSVRADMIRAIEDYPEITGG